MHVQRHGPRSALWLHLKNFFTTDFVLQNNFILCSKQKTAESSEKNKEKKKR